jgi:hypothetical protein
MKRKRKRTTCERRGALARDVAKRPHVRRRHTPAAEEREVLELAALAMAGGAFDWLYDPREDGYSFEDGKPIEGRLSESDSGPYRASEGSGGRVGQEGKR